MKSAGSDYRDETRLVLKCDVPKLLPVFKDLVAALPQNPVEPSNLSEFD